MRRFHDSAAAIENHKRIAVRKNVSDGTTDFALPNYLRYLLYRKLKHSVRKCRMLFKPVGFRQKIRKSDLYCRAFRITA